MTKNPERPGPSPFFHPEGPFHLGEPFALDVEERDYPTEYAAVQYLAVATAGRAIAVGHLALAYWEGPVGTHAAIGMVMVPGRGIWVLVPVFDEWAGARDSAAETWEMLRRVLGERLDTLPIQTAYIPTLGDEVPRGAAPDAATVYDTRVFADAGASLRPAAGATAAQVDAAIAELLEAGDWIDGKHDVEIDVIPRWLADLLAANVASRRVTAG